MPEQWKLNRIHEMKKQEENTYMICNCTRHAYHTHCSNCKCELNAGEKKCLICGAKRKDCVC